MGAHRETLRSEGGPVSQSGAVTLLVNRRECRIDADPDLSLLEALRDALERNLCRCGAHNRIVRAVLRAAAVIASQP